MTDYFTPKGGLPSQNIMHTGRAIFKEAYVFSSELISEIIRNKNLQFCIAK